MSEPARGPADVNDWRDFHEIDAGAVSRFDLAGRVVKNVPAPINLEIPNYRFASPPERAPRQDRGETRASSIWDLRRSSGKSFFAAHCPLPKLASFCEVVPFEQVSAELAAS